MCNPIYLQFQGNMHTDILLFLTSFASQSESAFRRNSQKTVKRSKHNSCLNFQPIAPKFDMPVAELVLCDSVWIYLPQEHDTDHSCWWGMSCTAFFIQTASRQQKWPVTRHWHPYHWKEEEKAAHLKKKITSIAPLLTEISPIKDLVAWAPLGPFKSCHVTLFTFTLSL